MKKIGGMFYYEPCKVAENGYFERVCPPDGDLAFTMSGPRDRPSDQTDAAQAGFCIKRRSGRNY